MYQNKITLLEIKRLVSSLEHQKEFINELFEPLKNPVKLTFLDSYLHKNTKTFMNGNYGKQFNKLCGNFNEIIRKNIIMLNNFAKQLQDGVIFNKMLDSVKKVADVGVLNAEHEVFGLIEKDIEAMPEDFVKCINNYIDTGKFYEALLFLILWSIYGEYIKKLAPVYEAVSKNTAVKECETIKV